MLQTDGPQVREAVWVLSRARARSTAGVVLAAPPMAGVPQGHW
ncbi:hypothetical protein [Streptomyces sp. G7(2002)]|nr:hypothetical protein [Streptomyces sp. G7(2002)]WDT59093.1 hypothetical protein NUT86_36525 [Streptomyces sp. G7(2002)]